MDKNNHNVILFPSLKKELEKESLQALEQRKYSEALASINKLLSYQVYTPEIIVGKLICLMELGHYDQAETLCEDLLKQKNKHYYTYLHIYLSILFQSEKYALLMELIDDELMSNTLPNSMKEQFQQLYSMANQMNNDLIVDQSSKLIDDLYIAIDEKDYVKQWQLVESLRRINIDPPHAVITYLSKKNIHPVIKTAIFKWLVDRDITNHITVHKFDKNIVVKPANYTKIRDHLLMKRIISIINEIEQNNPSLYILIEQMLYRYMYVRYPFIPPYEDITNIANALIYIGEQYLHLEVSKRPTTKMLNYIEEIKMCEKLYLGIIEE